MICSSGRARGKLRRTGCLLCIELLIGILTISALGHQGCLGRYADEFAREVGAWDASGRELCTVERQEWCFSFILES